jgi:hypothetical protein
MKDFWQTLDGNKKRGVIFDFDFGWWFRVGENFKVGAAYLSYLKSQHGLIHCIFFI